MSFYVLAVIAAYLNLRIFMWLAFIGSFLYFGINFYFISNFQNGYDNGMYKDALTTAWKFSLRGLVYLKCKTQNYKQSEEKFYISLGLFFLIHIGVLSNALYGNLIEQNQSGWKILLFTAIVLTVMSVAYVLKNIPGNEPK